MVKTTDFGAFVSLLPGRDGLVHISKLGRGKRIAKVEDVVKVGDKLRVEIADIDNRGKISLILVAEDDAADGTADPTRPRRSMPRPPAARSAGTASRRAAPTKRRMAVRRTTLPGGLRVVTEYIPSVRSASVGVWVGVGSRDEGRSVAGAAHFLEHLLFKSTPTRTAVEIAQAVDAVGGELNAFTAREHTCYYAHVLDTDLELAVDLVADVVLRGRCAADDVEIERDVVLEEIAMRDDDPEDTLGDVFLSAMFGEHPVGRPVIGSVDSVSAMTRAQLHSFHVRRYTPERMVVAVAGNVDHDEVVALVREHFGPRLVRGRTPAAPRKGTGRVTGRPTLQLVNRDAEQTHLSLGVRTPGRHWEQRWALSVLNTALGGGLSSRLFQQIRETRGLAYSVYSTVDTFSDSGALSVYAACLPERFDEVVRVTTDVLEQVARDGITEAECRIAKGSLRGGLVLGLEDSGSRMNRIGRSELNYGEHRTIAQTLDRIEAVTLERSQRRRAPAADPAVRRRGPGSTAIEKVAATAASEHRGLICNLGIDDSTVQAARAARRVDARSGRRMLRKASPCRSGGACPADQRADRRAGAQAQRADRCFRCGPRLGEIGRASRRGPVCDVLNVQRLCGRARTSDDPGWSADARSKGVRRSRRARPEFTADCAPGGR